MSNKALETKDQSEAEFLLKLMNKANIGWWKADMRARTFTCSPFITQLLGLEEEGVISFLDFESRIAEDIEFGRSVVANLTQPNAEYIYLLDTANGKRQLRSKSCYSEKDEKGNTFVYGLTECLEAALTTPAEKTFQTNNRIMLNIYQNFPVGIELYDKDGFLIDVNQKDLDIFHLSSKEEVVGVNLFDNPNLTEEMKLRIKQNQTIDFTIQYDYAKIGGYYESEKQEGCISLMTKIATLYDSNRNPVNYLLINVEKTEETAVYNKIREFENIFALVGNYAKVGYAQFNILTKEGFAQSSWYHNIGEKDGTPMNQIIGINAHVHPEDRVAIFEFMAKAKQGLATTLSKEVRILRENGADTWASVNLLVKNYQPENNIVEITCVNYDITELKEAGENLVKAKEKAEESDRLKSAFLANMSHEIRTPLNSIVGFSSMLQETDDPEEKEQYLHIIEENNRLLLQLISDILDLSKIEAGKYDMSPSEINAQQLCEDLVKASAKRAKERVTLAATPNLPQLTFTSDKNRVQQVLLNFVNNAIKFTNEGCITLGYELQDRFVKFYVQDTGIGIDPKMQGEIFNRFVKLNNFIPGTGLGLPICQNIVVQMGGEIGVTSVPGQGSCFWFTHPYDN